MTAADVSRFLHDVAGGKTAKNEKTGFRTRIIVKGGKGAASRALGLLGGIFKFAVVQKLVDGSPVRGVPRFPDGQSERFLSPAELSRFGSALQVVEKDGANPDAIAILRLLIFTGARRNEIAGLRWSEVDIERAALRLSLERHKTGRRSGQGKIIPLTTPALRVLSTIRRNSESIFVFPASTGESHFQGIKRVWERVRIEAKLPGLRIHDLRHSFASVGLAGGDTLAMIGALLGHANTRATARYGHLANDVKAAAAARIANSIEASMSDGHEAKLIGLKEIEIMTSARRNKTHPARRPHFWKDRGQKIEKLKRQSPSGRIGPP